jgi:hypothetical protein
MHLHLHARSQKKYADYPETIPQTRKISQNSLTGLLEHLQSTIKKLNWQPEGTGWSGYYSDSNYSEQAFEDKKKLVTDFLDLSHPAIVWDLGANIGVFSRLAASRGILTISCDLDPGCVELNYRNAIQNHEEHLLPLVFDLTNPSPGIGWGNAERDSLIDRGPADMILALALIHHLVISNNVPFERVAEFLSRASRALIIEFIPKTDSQVQRMLLNRQDFDYDYSVDHFEDSFRRYFTLIRKEHIADSQRLLYLWQKKGLQ